MSEITEPILLDKTGKEISAKLDNIERAIRGIEPTEKQWTLKINTATYAVTMEGDINSWLTYRAKLGRYAMTNDGKARKLHRDNSLILEDGTAYDAASCHIMARYPNLYYSVNTSGDVVSVTLSEREFLNCKAFGDQWIGAYLGTVVSGALVSRADLNPTRSRTIESFWAAAQVNGADWGLSNYRQRQMMMVIYLCEFLSMNSQLNIGLGMTGEGNNWCEAVYGAKAGATSVLGDKCGKVNFLASNQLVAGACHVSLFGVEDPYGWFWEFVQGVYFGNSENANQDGTECYIYEGNRMPTSDELTGTPSGIYRKITRLTSSGWVRKLMWGTNLDVLPDTLGGGSVDGHGDYHYANSTGQVLLWGGCADDGSCGGLAYSISCDGWSVAYSSLGARLAYHGTANII